MRVGVLVPYANTNLEIDLHRFKIPDLNFYITRISGYEINKIPDANQMKKMGESDLSEALKLIDGVIPDAILYGCTSATLSHGLKFTYDLEKLISKASRCFAITASGALIIAMKALNIKNIAFASPYVGEINDKAIKYFLEAGFKTVSHSDIGRNLSNYEQGTLSSEKIIDLAYKADSKNCEAIVISCTDLKAVEVINTIETNLGKPVITSNQAMIFALLRAFNLKPNDSFPGQLFKVIKK
tara:strand:+ start:329 stop:1051 length:723 start_codon:yes stop_codon:yes gene_type:complete